MSFFFAFSSLKISKLFVYNSCITSGVAISSSLIYFSAGIIFWLFNHFKSKAFFGHALIQLQQSIHSVPFFLLRESSNISTFIGHTLKHL